MFLLVRKWRDRWIRERWRVSLCCGRIQWTHISPSSTHANIRKKHLVVSTCRARLPVTPHSTLLYSTLYHPTVASIGAFPPQACHAPEFHLFANVDGSSPTYYWPAGRRCSLLSLPSLLFFNHALVHAAPPTAITWSMAKPIPRSPSRRPAARFYLLRPDRILHLSILSWTRARMTSIRR